MIAGKGTVCAENYIQVDHGRGLFVGHPICCQGHICRDRLEALAEQCVLICEKVALISTSL